MATEKPPAPADTRQVGGNHYRSTEGGEQHWDRVHRLGLNWYAANVTKYVERYKEKNGLQDLRKAQHYLDKLIEVELVNRAREDGRINPFARKLNSQAEQAAQGAQAPTGGVSPARTPPYAPPPTVPLAPRDFGPLVAPAPAPSALYEVPDEPSGGATSEYVNPDR